MIRSKIGSFLAKMKQPKTAVVAEEEAGQSEGGVVVTEEAKKEDSTVAPSKFGAFLAKMKEQKTAVGAEEETGQNEGGVVVTEEAKKEDSAIVGKEEDGESGVENCDPVGTETDTKMKTFDGGFFTVNSPVHSPVLQQKCKFYSCKLFICYKYSIRLTIRVMAYH